MAEPESQDRRLSWFSVAINPQCRKAGLESRIRDEEERQRKKIHREEIAEEEQGREHEYDHGQDRHEQAVIDIVHDSGDKDIWNRMDRYTQEELDAIDREEEAQAKRIHDDHTGPGVPAFVGKYSHGIKKHAKKLKGKIRAIREKEKEEVKERIDKSLKKLLKAVNSVDMGAPPVDPPALLPTRAPKPTRIAKLPSVAPVKAIDPDDMAKSAKKKKKKGNWPSFDVQSSQIARREGVSEKAADAMLASRARNH